MSEPVLEKSKSTLSKGASSAPQTWAEYKERLKVFGWQNGTSYKWYYFYCALIWICGRKLRQIRPVWVRGGWDIYFIVFFLISVSTACFFYSCENACNLSRKSIWTYAFVPSDREWSRQRDESLIDILTEFGPCRNCFLPLFYRETKKKM
mgnify:FL=1